MAGLPRLKSAFGRLPTRPASKRSPRCCRRSPLPQQRIIILKLISNAVAPKDAVDVAAVPARVSLSHARILIRRFGPGGALRTERLEPRLLLVVQPAVERVDRRVHGVDLLQHGVYPVAD